MVVCISCCSPQHESTGTREQTVQENIRRIRRSVGRGYVYGVLCVGEGSDRRSMAAGITARATCLALRAHARPARRLLLHACALHCTRDTFRGARRTARITCEICPCAMRARARINSTGSILPRRRQNRFGRKQLRRDRY